MNVGDKLKGKFVIKDENEEWIKEVHQVNNVMSEWLITDIYHDGFHMQNDILRVRMTDDMKVFGKAKELVFIKPSKFASKLKEFKARRSI